ncbi:MAG: hypothetical protein RTU63_01840 [Candidatus Thorarchaeota archaeon]
MPNCPSCGAGVDASDRECPYCGASVLQRTEGQKSTMKSSESTFSAREDADGNTQIRFGEGKTGSRPPSGIGGISSTYRQGAGSQGNVPSKHLEEKLDQVTRKLDRVPDPSKHKGSKDVGIALIESMSAMGDLLSMYQDVVASEAHLSTDDRDRLSKKEERIRPKLQSMVAFCDRVDSKTKKNMRLSDSDIHKIRTTATRALQMTTSRSGKCAGCGTTNKPGARHCQNCGAPL